MKILVTGANGYVGSRVCQFGGSKHEITALVRPSSNISLLADSKLHSLVRSETSNWKSIIQEIRPHSVVLCDWNGVRGSAREFEDQEANCRRQLELLEAAAQSGVKNLINLGSQAEVGQVESEIQEAFQGNPLTKYGIAKKNLSQNFLEFSGGEMRVIWARVFSLYGTPQSDEWFIPKLVSALAKNQDFEMTLGEQIWNYLHVDDCARAIIYLLENDNETGIVNVAHPESITLRNIADIIHRNIATSGRIKFGSLPYRPSEPMSLLPAIHKLNRLGWRPEKDLEEGIREFIYWKTNGK
jgi:UDP-glucose 4-epimerase